VTLAEVPIVRLGAVVRELGLTGLGVVQLAAEMEVEASGLLRVARTVRPAPGPPGGAGDPGGAAPGAARGADRGDPARRSGGTC
jgi:hypothetical protein